MSIQCFLFFAIVTSKYTNVPQSTNNVNLSFLPACRQVSLISYHLSLNIMFVHLHTHTHYSLLDGLAKIPEMVDFAREQGSPALAITDHGVMYGVIEFYKACKKAEIKPIIGVELYLAPDLAKKDSSEDRLNRHIVLLAKNNQGYKNLIKLVSIAHLEGFYYKPRVDWPTLSKYSDGLIACTACLGGEIPHLLMAGQTEKAEKRILEYNQLFGQGNFYLEIQDHPHLKGQNEMNKTLKELSKKLNIPLVATNDIHYFAKTDNEAQDILLCLQNKKKIEDTDRMNMMDSDYSMRPNKEMVEAFADTPEAIGNTLKIAEMCNVELDLGNVQLPYFQVPENFDELGYLGHLAKEGLKEKYGKSYEEIDQVKKDRLDYEMSVIKKMGWPSYFLIVADFINWAKKNGIVVGPGRGSAAGSFVCYLIGITGLDPLEYDLLFERFLNPERISMPDIDTDFADTRRDEVIRYVEDKYGKDHVSQIITFGTMAARASIRDVGRVLGAAYDYCDKIAKAIPMFTDIERALATVPEFKEIYQEPEAKKIIDYAKRLEGVSRHSSTHACGVLITKDPLTEYVPLQYASSSDRSVVSQYSLHPIEDLGILKMDFLGLSNLTIIESTINIVEKTKGINIDINNIALDDQETYKLFQKGETTGVFQFESSGMKRYLKELKPTQLEDIIAMVALYRPGPMEWIPDYIAGKHGRKKPKYLHEKLKPILDRTYGVAIYQEQVMQMARDLAGFTMGEADVLRKAVGKKIAELLAKQKEKFIEGCVKNGIAKNLAEEIFSFIEPFAGYGFNRSHAACYAMIGYQTAYLKAHYPAEFMAALLTSDQQNTDRVAIEIEECRNINIQVAAPDVNESFASFTVVKKEDGSGEEYIRFGLNAIKNVGEHIVEVLIKERKENGKYKDVFDLLERVVDKDMNKKSLESLIRCGALDSFGDRGMLLANLEGLLNFNKEISHARESKQESLFADAPGINMPARMKLEETYSTTEQDKLAWERELLGLYISKHPFGDYKKHLGDLTIPVAQLKDHINEETANVAGMITGIKKIITRSNKMMLFVRVEDSTGSTEFLIFPNLLEATKDMWQEGKAVLAQGRISDKDQEIKVLPNKAVILDLDNMQSSIAQFKNTVVEPRKKYNGNGSYSQPSPPPFTPPAPAIPLKLILKEDFDQARMGELKEILSLNPGRSGVFIKITENKQSKIIETGFKVDNSDKLKNMIRNDFGEAITIVDS